MEDRAFETFLLPMALKDNISGSIWFMGKRGSLAQTDAEGSFDGFTGNEALFSVADVSRCRLYAEEHHQ